MIVQARELRRYAPLLGRPAMMLAAADEIERLAAKLEAAEKERDALRAAVRHEADCVDAAKAEIDALRAKVEQMGRQEPVGVLHVGSYYGEELQDWEFEADQRVCDRLNERHVANPTSLNLYALPGAQPAPSVPDVDALAQFIREVDGSHQLGAGVLAERIAEWLKAAAEAKP